MYVKRKRDISNVECMSSINDIDNMYAPNPQHWDEEGGCLVETRTSPAQTSFPPRVKGLVYDNRRYEVI